MKFIIVFAALFAVALAAPSDVEIKSQHADVGPESFDTGFETSDGTKVDSAGVLNNVGTDHESIAVHGSFTFIAEDGKPYTVKYIADENGFQPQGEHLPHA